MGTFVMVGQVILALSILIILHELGHFLAARMFGIKVEKFYLFFDAWGVKLFKFNYKGCEYGIGWLPLGGYVKIAGMVDESMDTAQLQEEPQPWEFRSKPAWQRLIVMLGGIIVNVIVGIVVFWMLAFKYGQTDIDNSKLTNGIVPGIIGKEIGLQAGDKIREINSKPVVNYKDLFSSEVLMGDAILTIERKGVQQEIQVPSDILNQVADHKTNEFVEPRLKMMGIDQIQGASEAEKMGLQKDDSIVTVNGRSIVYFDQFKDVILDQAEKSITMEVVRDGQVVTLNGKVSADGTLGFGIKPDPSLVLITSEYGFMEALPIGTKKAFSVITDNIKGFGKIFKGEVRADKALSGPVGIAKMFGTDVDWYRFWNLVGMLSMALAFMNLLPIPALDGGHVIFLLVEMIQGKPLSDKFLERAQMVGFFILVALMIFTLGNDIIKW
ncbi:RIP metalloprotease RseP [Sphingobacterium alkalisoli]|uniref:Zinc metalloprotease n=1 Tax=Sphingobacterium alkalisoli TaxID=1874115 RepID=A0A4U0H2V9_9SPHI|nr:RIP metalloprotease RseP [Sphingobacterium alkalisoli]TJY65950.1 RIP metalloprotease RseP [Sphingobacterium alkalisoli]GGH17265.1 zinc metalloprotease [Sphingobacterium alkalisoli]